MSKNEAKPDDKGESRVPRSLTRFILRGGALVVIARLLVITAGLVIQMILARILPPEELGAYFLTQSIVSTIAVFSQVGLGRPLTRDLARFIGRNEVDSAKSLLLLVLRLSLVPVAGIAAIYAIGAGSWLANSAFSSPTMAGASVAAAGWIAGTAFQGLGAAATRGFHAVGAAAFLDGALSNLVVVAGLGLIIWTGSSTEFTEIVWIAALATWLNVGICVLLLGGRVRGVASKPSVTSRELLSAAIPLIGVQVAGLGFTQADLWMVGGLLPENDVALYGAAKRMARLVGVPIVALTLVVPPIVADLYARGEHARLQRLLRGSATLAGIPAVLVAIPCFILSDPLLGVVFGPFFANAGDLLKILCLERLAAVYVGPCVLVLTMTGHERDVLVVVVISGLLSLGAIFVGGLLGGALGIASAFAAAGVVRECLAWWLVWHRLRIRTDVDPMRVGAMRDAVMRGVRR
jgi:O-antigen/teichoic acid export membrane protein